jgi:hypothetical protein
MHVAGGARLRLRVFPERAMEHGGLVSLAADT